MRLNKGVPLIPTLAARRRLALAACGVAGVLLTAAACGSSGGTTTSTAATASAGAASGLRLAQPTTIKQLSVPYFGLEHIAEAQGFWKKYNLTVDMVTSLQGAQGVAGVVDGQVETMYANTPDTPLLAIHAGGKVKEVAASEIDSPTYDTVRYYVLKSSGITSAAGLAGKRVGMPATSSYYEDALLQYLKGHGVSPTKVTSVAVPATNLVGSLLSHQVSAIAVGDVFYAQLESKYASKVSLLFRDMTAFPSATKYLTGYIFSDSYIAAHPDVVRAYIAGLQAAAKFVQTNPEQARKDIAALTGQSPAGIPIPSYPSNLCINTAAAQTLAKQVMALGIVPAGTVTSPGQWVTNQYNPKCSS